MKSVSTLERDWEDVFDDSSENLRHEVQAANMLRALANPHRLKILKLLDQAPHNVMDMCERLSLRQVWRRSTLRGFVSMESSPPSVKATTSFTRFKTPGREKSLLFWMGKQRNL